MEQYQTIQRLCSWSPRRRKTERALEMFAEMMAENIPKMIKYIKLQIQETFLQNPGWPHPDKPDSHQ